MSTLKVRRQGGLPSVYPPAFPRPVLVCVGENSTGLVCTNNSGLEFVMAHVCQICGKGPQFGNNISHAQTLLAGAGA